MKLAEHYGDKPADELPMLFQRILSNCTLDWFRRQKTRNALFSNLSDFEAEGDDGNFDLLETFAFESGSQQTESAEDSTRRATSSMRERVCCAGSRSRSRSTNTRRTGSCATTSGSPSTSPIRRPRAAR